MQTSGVRIQIYAHKYVVVRTMYGLKQSSSPGVAPCITAAYTVRYKVDIQACKETAFPLYLRMDPHDRFVLTLDSRLSFETI